MMQPAAKPSALPKPRESGIDHIVAVTLENRSFDHFLGWLPNADGRQAGLFFTDKAGITHATHSLAGDFTGCPGADPDHSYNGARVAYNAGQMDGFLRAGKNDPFCLGFYGESDVNFFGALARNYTACDRYFASILGPTFPNRMFLHAAQTDRLDDGIKLSSLPTIWDRLRDAGVSATYFFSNVPYLALWGTRHLDTCRLHEDFIEAARAGTLPAVSFVDPHYTLIDDGAGNDDHPHADIRKGDKFLYDLFEAVAHGPNWKSTVFIINFDEWGGFFDHVPPPRVAAGNDLDPDLIDGKALLGLRVPTIIASPWSRHDPEHPQPSSMVFDHTSVLKFIEWRWSLSPLSPRDASDDVGNLAHALDFSNFQPAIPALPKPHPPFLAKPCFQNLLKGGIFSGGDYTATSPVTAVKTASLKQLKQHASSVGFPTP